ncbi:MAG: sensor histidine kinase [Coprobacillus cateniformis]
MYDRVVANMVNSTRNILSIQQIKYYEQQLEIMQTSIKANHSLLHDLKSHLIALKSCLKEGEIEEALAYIERMLEFNTTGQTELAKTGNKIIDSIINFKLQEAIDKKIDVTAKIKIPEALEMDSFDATVIIGNILDNAIEAASKAEHERKLNVLLIYDRRRIVFEVDNTYSGCINMEQGALRTNKENWLNHGIGLQNVGLVAEKYNGTVDINFDDDWFKICVMFYT